MKICLITPSYLPVTGGAETTVHELSKRLAQRGYKVTIVTFNHKNAASFESSNGVEIYRTPLLRLPLGRSIASQPFVLRKLLKLNEKKNFDILHQFYVFYLGGACVLAKKISRKPLITSLTGMDTYDPINPLPRIFNPYMGWVMNNSDTITSHCNELVNHARDQGLRKDAVIIPAGVDLGKFNPNNNGAVIRSKLGIKDKQIVVFSIQRLVPRKKLDYLINSIPSVIRENPQVRFVIGGEGPEKERLKGLAQELGVERTVLFTGFIPEEELPLYYAGCDLFVLHTMYEAFGVVLAEAMASGKPVISTNVGAIPEVIDDGKTGIIVSPEDSEALAGAILKLAKDEDLRLRMGLEGKRKAIKEYDWDCIVERFIGVYQDLIEGSRVC